eukprot:CAMPEP_0169417240 /NCGR_PEP_ID=MMETSP1017-20121227/63602_1 /TAXON_ID=342587 /ORGANISM="Karlodinium micrum, Strain CCMP2283" /LENGTH=79 /DNA_ID=CAMNT_0009525345 /DNA_START=51 /DNA_END=286 /DNA_ORIENTATION=+
MTRLGQVATGHHFEALFAVIVVMDILLMALGVQVDGMKTADELGLGGFYGNTQDFVEWMRGFLRVAEYVFGVLYSIELV